MGTRSADENDDRVLNNVETGPYEEVSESVRSVYAELKRNQEDEKTNDNIYQKLIMPDSDYVNPEYFNEKSPYEEVERKKSFPGHADQNQTELEENDDALYQNLVKK